MVAPKGNQFWKARSSSGRNPDETVTFKFYTGIRFIDWDAALRETARKKGLEHFLPPDFNAEAPRK